MKWKPWELCLFIVTALCHRIPILLFRDQSGVVKFYGSFAFNRKRNVLELEIKQDYTSPGTQKYVVRSIFHILPIHLSVMWTLMLKIMFINNNLLNFKGPLKVTVQELDGSFNHTLQIEENSLKHDIPCHSKSRR